MDNPMLESREWYQEVVLTGWSENLPFPPGLEGGIGGDMGTALEDFEVTEIPCYPRSGSGEHVYLYIEKRDMTTFELLRSVSSAFKTPERDIGYAGMKDRHGITRQWVSFVQAGGVEEGVSRLESMHGGLRVLEVTRHTNKLRLGHLAGNRFGVRLFGVTGTDAEIDERCRILSRKGFINYFGRQRFGADGGNVASGKRILNGHECRKYKQQKFLVSALQSAIFNLYAAERITEKGYDVFAGDVMQKIGGGCFVCEDPETDRSRAEAGEIAVTGVLPGGKVMQGSGFSVALEHECALRYGVQWPEDVEAPNCLRLSEIRKFGMGCRRPLWVRPDGLRWHRERPDVIWIEFVLDSGSYATVLLRQICGNTFSR